MKKLFIRLLFKDYLLSENEYYEVEEALETYRASDPDPDNQSFVCGSDINLYTLCKKLKHLTITNKKHIGLWF